MNGGTLLTITGGHFSEEILYNPVKVGEDIYCYVIESNDGQIKCRVAHIDQFDETDKTLPEKNSEVPLIVFLRTSEEATCTYARDEDLPNVITPNCNYKWI